MRVPLCLHVHVPRQSLLSPPRHDIHVLGHALACHTNGFQRLPARLHCRGIMLSVQLRLG